MKNKFLLAEEAIKTIVMHPAFRELVKETGDAASPKESFACALLLVDALIEAFGPKEN